MKSKIALVTGANRGMGLAASEKLASLGHHVILVGRNKGQLEEETSRLKSKNYSVENFAADVSIEADLFSLRDHVLSKHQRLDILINNAGIYIEEGNIFSSTDKTMKNTLETNTMGPYRLMREMIPLMLKNGYGRVVNVSSGLGSFNGASTNCPAYCVSKAALNMLTNLFAQEVRGSNIKVNSVCPGWVKTDMGGASAPRSIEEGIAGIIWAATLDDNGPNGGFFRDGKPLEW